LVQVTEPPSGFVSVKLVFFPVPPVDLTVIDTDVLLVNVTPPTRANSVELDRDAVNPLTKFAPVIGTAASPPCGTAAGDPSLGELTVGPAFTTKPLASEPVPASVEFVTVTVRAPVAAPDSTVTFAVSSVALTKLVDSTVMPAPKDEVAPLAKFLPLIVIVCLLAP
jgi:hypothetical protein